MSRETSEERRFSLSLCYSTAANVCACVRTCVSAPLTILPSGGPQYDVVKKQRSNGLRFSPQISIRQCFEKPVGYDHKFFLLSMRQSIFLPYRHRFFLRVHFARERNLVSPCGPFPLARFRHARALGLSRRTISSSFSSFFLFFFLPKTPENRFLQVVGAAAKNTSYVRKRSSFPSLPRLFTFSSSRLTYTDVSSGHAGKSLDVTMLLPI